MSRSVCLRCAAERTRYDQVCPSCGHTPTGDGLLVAWLLSSQHLSDAELEAAAAHIRDNKPLRPSNRQLDIARRALGTHYDSDPGLTRRQKAALLATSLLLTPLPGWVLWASWRGQRPRAAWQALALSAPATLLFTAAVLWLRLA